MSKEVIKPFLVAGSRYVVELFKCGLLGFVFSAAVTFALLAVLPAENGLFRIAAAGAGCLFLLLYALAGHQRGIFAMLNQLVRAHGALLYEQTLGRFERQMEAQRPGTLLSMLSAPGRLAAGFRQFLLGDGTTMPKPVRRVAGYYVDKLDAKATLGGRLPTDLVVEGQLQPQALKTWAVAQMNEQFEPSWTLFSCFAGAQLLLAAVLGVAAR